MKTEIFRGSLHRAAELIRRGGLVAVPTETVYGLACSGLDEDAVRRIYEVKGRPAVKPLSLMVSGAEAIDGYCQAVPPAARLLAEKFWPGPLTIVLKAKSLIPPIVLSGGDTVGLRCPDHPMTLELLRLTELPFAAPSANPSGAESPKTAEAVAAYFDGLIEGIVDGGPCGIGRESTIIDMSRSPYRILRPGALPADTVADALVDGIRLIGITGGSGCGKTTALKELEALGALVIDCDSVYHRMLESSRELLRDIERRFPGSVKNGVLDRKALGEQVFSHSEALAELNAITHRQIILELRRMLRGFAMSGGTLAAIDAIELIGSGLAEDCDTTIGVLAAPEKRIERIMARDGVPRDYAEMRIKAQRPDTYFVENCRQVLYNNGSEAEFKDRCRQLFKEILTDG